MRCPVQLQCVAVAAMVGHSTSAGAQAANRDSLTEKPRARVMIAAGARYRAGWLHRAVLGTDYRALWTTPIEVGLLDLRSVAGGLTPTQRGGSLQTKSLRFSGADGREYVFRSSEKDFEKGLPAELRGTLIGDIVQDQVSGYHPAAPLVVARLLDATGIHHARPRLVVMPNDSLLGEFRADFAGLLGTIEERPGTDFDESPESLGATDVISTERLFERLRRNSSNVVDTRAFLAARLFDVLIGDRDRHRDQWRWARFSGEPNASWLPVPRDRDMAFSKSEGLGLWAIRRAVPQLVHFGVDFPDMVWLNWNAREIDRSLLVGLERPVWDSVAQSLQAQMTDAVVDSAIAEMPSVFAKLSGARLRDELINRRRHLDVAANQFYRVMATEVDLNGTDEIDLVAIAREDDGSVLISFSSPSTSDGGAAVYFQRRFHPDETREVRVFLHGGADRAVVRGTQAGGILVRIIGGAGDDTVLDSIPNGDRALRFYDAAGNNSFVSPAKHGIDRRVYVAPLQQRPQDVVRDWGKWSSTLGGVSLAPGRGLVAGTTLSRFGYGFRSHPFASHSTVGLDFSFAERRPRLTYAGEFRSPAPDRWFNLDLMASGIELIRFHGYGNESASDRKTTYYRVMQNLFRVAPAWALLVAPEATLSLGVTGQFTSTREGAQTLIGETKPYGSEDFGQVGAKLDLVIDHRNSQNFPTTGYRVAAGGALYPPLWSVVRTFGEAHVAASAFASVNAPLSPTLALRAGARHVWGAFPFHDAASLGGVSTLRGWDEQRFAGRSAVSGSAEVRLHLGQVRLIAPAEFGVLGFMDAGRIMADIESSDVWHTGVGGGIWIAPLVRSHTVSLSFARGNERTGFYLSSGFAF